MESPSLPLQYKPYRTQTTPPITKLQFPSHSLSMASTLAFLILFFLRAVSEPEPQTTSFSFSNFDQDTNFQSNIAISGDSKVINGGSAIQLAGKAMYKKSVQILQGNPSNLVSFSTNFSFSLSGGIGDGLAFFMAPIRANLSKLGALDGILSVEFETSKEAETDHVREAQVKVNLGSMVTVRINNASSLVSYTGQRLYCWIDYEAGSRVLEVSLTELGDQRPQNPILLHQLDLTKTWKDREVHTGLSSNGVCFIYSWSFRLRKVPHWMHSQPLDPSAVSKEVDNPSVREKKKCNCVLKLLATSIFATASVALGSVLVLYVCAMFGSRRRTVVKTLDCEYKKVKVFVADKVVKDGL